MNVSFTNVCRILVLGLVYSLLVALLAVLVEDSHAHHINGERSAISNHLEESN